MCLFCFCFLLWLFVCLYFFICLSVLLILLFLYAYLSKDIPYAMLSANLQWLLPPFYPRNIRFSKEKIQLLLESNFIHKLKNVAYVSVAFPATASEHKWKTANGEWRKWYKIINEWIENKNKKMETSNIIICHFTHTQISNTLSTVQAATANHNFFKT